MALAQTVIKADLVSLFDKMKKKEMSEEDYAGSLAEIMVKHIKTATVTVGAGIPVSTGGTATAQTGATTAPGTGSLS